MITRNHCSHCVKFYIVQLNQTHNREFWKITKYYEKILANHPVDDYENAMMLADFHKGYTPAYWTYGETEHLYKGTAEELCNRFRFGPDFPNNDPRKFDLYWGSHKKFWM